MKKVLLVLFCFLLVLPFFNFNKAVNYTYASTLAPSTKYNITNPEFINPDNFTPNLFNDYFYNNLTLSNFNFSFVSSQGSGSNKMIAYIWTFNTGTNYDQTFTYHLSNDVNSPLYQYTYTLHCYGTPGGGYVVDLDNSIFITLNSIDYKYLSDLKLHIVPDDFVGDQYNSNFNTILYCYSSLSFNINYDSGGYYAEFFGIDFVYNLGDEDIFANYANHIDVSFTSAEDYIFTRSFSNVDNNYGWLFHNLYNSDYDYITNFSISNFFHRGSAYSSENHDYGLSLFINGGTLLTASTQTSTVSSTFGVGNSYYRSAEWWELGTHIYNLIIYLIFDAPIISDVVSLIYTTIQFILNIFNLTLNMFTSPIIVASFIGFLVLAFIFKLFI